ncbi:WD40 repeat-like protein, partial [Mycena floridula]
MNSSLNSPHVLQIPAAVTCLARNQSGKFLVGSDDGSVRVYNSLTLKVIKAIRGLGAEISSIVSGTRPGLAVWLACGQKVMSFNMENPKMILVASDASSELNLCEADDVLNELAIHPNETHIAFSTDSGTVGVVHLSTMKISRMKTKHTSICGSVKFIPDRPNELVSAGYDMTLLHFDFTQGTLLSRRTIPPLSSAGGMSLSPPFIMATALSPSAVLASGTADGRFILGIGGEKRTTATKKKRSRKWNGLDEDAEMIQKVAEGPIVAMQFSDDGQTITMSTLLGNMLQFKVETGAEGVALTESWQGQTKTIIKVNALVVDSSNIIVGGIAKDAKGSIEIYNH